MTVIERISIGVLAAGFTIGTVTHITPLGSTQDTLKHYGARSPPTTGD